MQTGMRVALLLVAVTPITSASAVTPITKVLQLLKDLGDKVDSQGRKEAIQYEKFSCFCKHQAIAKRAAIAKSVSKLEVLSADLSDLSASMLELSGNVQGLNTKVTRYQGYVDFEAEIQALTNVDGDRAKYFAKAKDLSEAIASCEEGIAALKANKLAMKDADLNLAQLKTAAFNAKLAQSPENLKEVLSLVKTASRAAQATSGVAQQATIGAVQQAPAAFAVQSNDIIATIEGILRTFKEEQREMDIEEAESRSSSQKKVLALTNEVSFAEKERKEKEAVLDDKTGKKSRTDQIKDKEEKAKSDDEKFLASLITNCGAKANEWDQRSTARAEEITALAEATTFLEKGALAQYNVNKKLTGLVKVSAKKLSFLQIGKGAMNQAEIGEKVLALLDTAAANLKSPVLSALAFKVQLKIDHFSNVRALIKDLVTKLATEAQAEATTKSFCDTQVKTAAENRDNAVAKMEENNGKIARQTAVAEEQAAAAVDLANEIAEENKERIEGEKFRLEEKADNAVAVAEARAGAQAVSVALDTLKKFYAPEAPPAVVLLQAEHAQPGVDRDGVSVADAAPEAFSGEYKGAQAESKGILGILEVIHRDFERSVETIEEEEGKAVAAAEVQAENLEDEAETQLEEKEEFQEGKADAELEIVNAQGGVNEAASLKAGSKAELEKLSSMCIDGEETYEERVAKREKEVAALREAVALLDQLMA